MDVENWVLIAQPSSRGAARGRHAGQFPPATTIGRLLTFSDTDTSPRTVARYPAIDAAMCLCHSVTTPWRGG